MTENKFIELTLGNHMISHGYDDSNKEILEVIENEPSKKLVAIDRIKSVSEKYILIDYVGGRLVYWEYEEDYDYVKRYLLPLS